jgi:hypothetical protein
MRCAALQGCLEESMKTTILALTLALTMPGGTAGAFQPSTKPATKGNQAKTQAPTGSLSPVQQSLRRNAALADRVAERLPARIDVMWAASGFRDLGQFVAAVNAAYNLQIPFMTLKSRLLDDRMSLGQAIRDLRRSSDYRKEAKRAQDEAKAMMRAKTNRKSQLPDRHPAGREAGVAELGTVSPAR